MMLLYFASSLILFCRAKVARDEAEDLRRKDEKERQRRALQLDAKIGRLRARAVESGHECVKDEKPKLIKNEDLDGQDGQALELPEVFGSEKKKRRKSVGDGKFRDDRCGTGHINLFNDEEIQFKKAETAHAKYLAEVGHESTVRFSSSIQRVIFENFLYTSDCILWIVYFGCSIINSDLY